MLSIFEDFAKQLAVHNRRYNNFLLSTILTFDTFDTCFPLLFFISNIFFDKCIFSSKIFSAIGFWVSSMSNLSKDGESKSLAYHKMD